MAVVARWLAVGLIALGGCSRVEEPARDRLAASIVASAPSVAPTPPSLPLVTPTQLLTLPSSAYQALLFADADAIELLTSESAFRLVKGKEPRRRALDLGFAATVTRQSYVYWSKGALWSAARRAPTSDAPQQLAALSEQPQQLVADIAADELAWLHHSHDDRYAIEKLEQRRVKRLYTSSGSIDTLTMLGRAIYFVERPSAAGWRIGRVELAGGEATFTELKTGRWPALLRGRDEVVYYDGSRRQVLSMAFDLKRERTLATDFICSPLTASVAVYCSSLDGIFELSGSGQPQRLVAASANVVAGLAASSEQLAFVADAGLPGQDRLSVSVVPLRP
jgi:hypothetical protein